MLSEKYATEAIELREALHAMPEPALHEFKTQAFVMGYLKSLGLDPQESAGTGAVCYIDLAKASTAAIRADMDALPLNEETGLAFASQHAGYAHACGHDAHMAMSLAYAKAVVEGAVSPAHNILLMFQPAEEGPGGAQRMISEGILEKYAVGRAYGIHLHPSFQMGGFYSKAGAFFADSVELYFSVEGKAAHGAQPENGKDALLAVSHLAIALSSLTSKALSPLDNGVLMLGRMGAGERLNITAGTAFLEGSLRTFSEESKKAVIGRIYEICDGIGLAFGVKCSFSPVYFYPCLINDAEIFRQGQIAAGIQEAPVQMLAEDFAYFAQKVPSLYVLLGINDGSESHSHALHSPKFDFDQSVLVRGVELYDKLLAE
ncbi:MAG: M20 family metallopeptidase [Eubacteriaceae bacterium]|nr:M20 family metallopeptidase [Eubacteriaceae bacterium]